MKIHKKVPRITGWRKEGTYGKEDAIYQAKIQKKKGMLTRIVSEKRKIIRTRREPRVNYVLYVRRDKRRKRKR